MKREIWFGEIPGISFLEVDGNDIPIENEIYMWRMVIDQAMQDLIGKTKEPKSDLHREQARMWFAGESILDDDTSTYNDKEFITVCEYAHIDPIYVQRWVKKVSEERVLS